jgi:cytochrome o ubiquinol oxidase subunit II
MKRVFFQKTVGLLVLGTSMLLTACSPSGYLLLEPRGPIGLSERNLILTTIGLMLIVVIPVFVMTFWFAWKYRASNTHAVYMPRWSFSGRIEALVWLVPTIIVTILGVLAWISSHNLNPYKPIDTAVSPLRIEVIALDWKWLFIYPDQGIATVNQLVIPVNVPVAFEITSDTVMNSFFIPRLGGQIYAMAGMETSLHLMADKPGSYFGENTQYSGLGFPYQHFEAVAKPRRGFEKWIKEMKKSPRVLDEKSYSELARPSVRNPVTYYSSVKPRLFEDVMAKYRRGDMKKIHRQDHGTL